MVPSNSSTLAATQDWEEIRCLLIKVAPAATGAEAVFFAVGDAGDEAAVARHAFSSQEKTKSQEQEKKQRAQQHREKSSYMKRPAWESFSLAFLAC